MRKEMQKLPQNLIMKDLCTQIDIEVDLIIYLKMTF